MLLDELIALCASEPPRSITREVRVVPEDMRARLRGRPLSEWAGASQPTGRHETRTYGHLLGPPASAEVVARWTAAHPKSPLPEDLRDLVRRVDGIHLWADLEAGRAHQGLAPIAEWQPAELTMRPGTDPTVVDPRFVALTYERDAGAFVVLDTATGRYALVDITDSEYATGSAPLAKDVGGLLDWLWAHRIPPRP